MAGEKRQEKTYRPSESTRRRLAWIEFKMKEKGHRFVLNTVIEDVLQPWLDQMEKRYGGQPAEIKAKLGSRS